MTIGQILPNDSSILAVVLIYNKKTGLLETVTSCKANDEDFRLSYHFIEPEHFIADKTCYVFFAVREG